MTSRLNYGHFGQAAYDPDGRQWVFQRVPRSRAIHQSAFVHASINILPSSSSDAKLEVPVNDLKDISNRNPEVEPAWDIIVELLREDEQIRFSSDNDVPVGKLISYAPASPNTSGDDPALIACPGGPNGEHLRVSTTDGLTTVSWNENSEPVRQILFASKYERKGYLLALRLSTRTIIFRLRTRAGDLQRSELNLTLLASIPISQTGDAPHADITFDPTDQSRFALIDVKGRWMVLQLKNKRVDSIRVYTVREIGTGCLIDTSSSETIPQKQPAELREDLSLEDPEDGLESSMQEHRPRPVDTSHVRLLWVHDVLLVLSKWHLFGISTADIETSHTLKMDDFLHEAEEIQALDLAAHPLISGLVFVLTTRSLTCLQLTEPSSGWSSVNTAPKFSKVAAWSHFCDRADNTLRLAIGSNAAETSIIIHSQATSNMIHIRLPSEPKHSYGGVVSEDAGYLMLSDGPVSDVRSYARFSSITLSTEQRSKLGPSIFTLRNDFSVYSFDLNRLNSQANDSLPQKALSDSRIQQITGADAKTDPRSVPNDRVYLRLDQRYESHNTARERFEQSFAELVDDLKATIVDNNRARAGTLFEMIGGSLGSEDIERMDGHLSTIKSLIDEDLWRSISVNFDTGESHPFSLSALNDLSLPTAEYDLVVRRWIMPLSQSVPGASRLRLWTIANRLAIEKCLSDIFLQKPHMPTFEDIKSTFEVHADESDRSRQDGRTSEGRSITGDAESHRFLQANAIDPNARIFDDSSRPSSPHTTASVTSGSSWSSAADVHSGNTAYQELSRWTKVSGQPQLLPKKMSRLLAHWNVGANPANYSWNTTRRQIERGSEAALRRRAEKRARRTVLRDEREARLASLKASQDARRARAASQYTEDTGPRSSPGPSGQRVGTMSQNDVEKPSQSSNLDMNIASQIEPGPHGGRPPATKKSKTTGLLYGKRPRRAGF